MKEKKMTFMPPGVGALVVIKTKTNCKNVRKSDIHTRIACHALSNY